MFGVDSYWERRAFESSLARFAAATKGDLKEILENQARLFVQDVVKVTPPFWGGVSATKARQTGEKQIKRNLNKLFIARPLVGSRKITHLFGKTDAPGLPYTVKTTEKYPDVRGIYNEEKSKARLRAVRNLKFHQRELPVSLKKVRAIFAEEKKKVGWLAGGWNRAAVRLGAKVPAWVARHGSSPGAIRMRYSKSKLSIRIENRVSYANNVGGMEKRMLFAVRKRTDAMRIEAQRAIDGRGRYRR